MTCVVLAAGYATRLYPLTKNFPKPLLDVQGKTVLDWLLEDVDTISCITRYVIISNHTFLPHFEQWKNHCKLTRPIVLLDDLSTENDNRLGAVKDIVFAVETLSLDDDLLVLAGDNVLEFSLKGFVDFFDAKQATCIMTHYEKSQERLKRTGVAQVRKDALVLEMAEKPENPKSHWAVPPFYVYKREDLPRIQKAINDGCNIDAPGSFIAWLCNWSPVYAYEMPGRRLDIGNLESYEEVKRDFKGRKG